MIRARQQHPLRPIAAAALLLVLSPAVLAQAAPTAAAAPPQAASDAATGRDKLDTDQLNAVVVTGTATAEGQRKLATSFSITTASEEQIKEAAPSSAADLLKIVPGVYAETSGGVSGPNIEVRGFPTDGDAPYVTMQLDGSPLYPVPTLSFMDNSSLFRLDDTLERVEVLRGGPSPIWSNGQAGATVNFIQKRGDTDQDGVLSYTIGTGDLQRVDAYWGGQLAPTWFLSGGGFYRTDNGVRNTQFPTDDGGQFSLNLLHKFDDGEFTLWGRTTNDKNTFFSDIPLIANGSSISSFPGINALTGALQGNALRDLTIETAPGVYKNLNLADGRGLNSNMYGFDLSRKSGDWTFSDKASYMSADVPTTALFTGPNPQTLGSYISSAITTANQNTAITGLVGAASNGTASFVNSGAAITDMSQQVIDVGVWSVDKQVNAFTNDARLSRELGHGNTLSFGYYLSSYSSHDVWYLGNSMLMTAASNAQPVNVVLNNGAMVTHNGFDGGVTYNLDAYYTGRNQALTLADDWQLTPKIRVDAGLRTENEDITGSIGNTTTGPMSSNPLSMYDDAAQYQTGTFSPLSYSASKTSYTLGGNYMVNDDLNTFVRMNSGFRMPSFDDLRSGDTTVETVQQYEMGLKTAQRDYHAFLTAFYNKFVGQLESQILTDGSTLSYILNSQAYGLEFEGAYRIGGFELSAGGDWMKGSYINSGPITGNQVVRQPDFQVRVTPSYRFVAADAEVKLYATYAYIGQRYSDVLNTQALPAYATLDAGLVANYGDYELHLTGTNLTNTIGITEGNPRVVGSGTTSGGVFLGRPIFGRAIQLSLAMHF